MSGPDSVLRGRVRLLSHAATTVGIVFAAYYWYLLTVGPSNPVDARAYHGINLDDLYGGWYLGGPNSFQYSPAFAQLIAPLLALPLDVFVAVWRGISFVLLVWMAGPFTLPVMLLSPVASELNAGNVNLMLGAAMVVGFRKPSTWSFVLLTKITPGIGLLWFATRREWRMFARALGMTLAIFAVSFVISPGQWIAWFELLRGHGGDSTASFPYFVPLAIRLPAGVLVVVAAAAAGLPWAVVIGATIATPNLYFPTQAIAVGAVALIRRADWSHGGLIPRSLARGRSLLSSPDRWATGGDRSAPPPG